MVWENNLDFNKHKTIIMEATSFVLHIISLLINVIGLVILCLRYELCQKNLCAGNYEHEMIFLVLSLLIYNAIRAVHGFPRFPYTTENTDQGTCVFQSLLGDIGAIGSFMVLLSLGFMLITLPHPKDQRKFDYTNQFWICIVNGIVAVIVSFVLVSVQNFCQNANAETENLLSVVFFSVLFPIKLGLILLAGVVKIKSRSTNDTKRKELADKIAAKIFFLALIVILCWSPLFIHMIWLNSNDDRKHPPFWLVYIAAIGMSAYPGLMGLYICQKGRKTRSGCDLMKWRQLKKTDSQSTIGEPQTTSKIPIRNLASVTLNATKTVKSNTNDIQSCNMHRGPTIESTIAECDTISNPSDDACASVDRNLSINSNHTSLYVHRDHSSRYVELEVIEVSQIHQTCINMDANLFNKYNVVDDVKYLILLQLDEEEIHWIMSNVNKKWNSLCKSTFNDERFKYKFIKYYEKLLKLDINAEKPIEILVECLWDRLWTKGTVVSSSSNEVVVKVKTHLFNPFNKENLINDPKNHEMVTNSITYSPLIKNGKSSAWFDDEYHHIAPLNTINKYKTVKPSIHNHLSKIITNYKNKNNGNMKIDDCKISSSFSDASAPDDRFGRLLVDILGPHCTKHHILISNPGAYVQNATFFTYQSYGYTCGIIDVNALELYFPDWNDDSNDSDRFYQIPIIYDVTSRLFNNNTKREPKTLEIDKNDDKVLCYQNLFKYGKNRYFTRIWIHPNDTHLYQPFGTDPTAFHDLRLLLATPAFNKQNTHDYNVENYDFIKDSKLAVKQLFNDYIIEIENNEELAMFKTLNNDDKSNSFKQNVIQNGKYCNKVIQIAGLANSWTELVLLHYKNKHKTKYHFDQVTEDCDYSSDIDYKNFYPCDIDTNIDDFETLNCFKSYGLRFRPIINFDMYSLIKQFENFRQLPYYTQERIKLVESCLFKTDAFMQIIDESDTFQQLIKENSLFYHFVYVKPKAIAFAQINDIHDDKKDIHWDYEKWGNETKEKYGKFELSMGRKDTYSVPIKEWKVGIIMDWTQHKTKHDFINYLYNFTGQKQVFLDITKEFDEFQQSLKRDWFMVHQDVKEKKNILWDNRKYFTDGTLTSTKNKNMNKVFLQYFVHLDQKDEVKPLF